MNNNLHYIIGAALLGLPLWLYGYFWHKDRDRGLRDGVFYRQMFNAPRWLVMVSGVPRPDNHLEVGAVTLQIAGLFLFVAPLIMVLMEVGIRTRVLITVLVPLSLMAIGLSARFVLANIRR